MENKPQNIFDKLDKQSEQIEDISTKLQGVSINDLYALAERTWNYGDFDTAQKYYNHICLLKPLEWKAALYASLCNYNKPKPIIDWPNTINRIENVCISTLKYLSKLDLSDNEKNCEINECIIVFIEEISFLSEHYFRNKDVFDKYSKNYFLSLEGLFLNVYYELKVFQNERIFDSLKKYVDICLGYISKIGEVISSFDKDKFDEMVKISGNNYGINYDEVYKKTNEKNLSKGIGLSVEEIKKIKLNGKLYYEYNDKVISKRKFKNKMIFGNVFVFLSILGVVPSFIYNWKFSFLFIPTILYGSLLILRAITQKSVINCSSIIGDKKMKSRLTSNGDVVVESKLNILPFCIILLVFAQVFIGIYFTVIIFNDNQYSVILKVLFPISLVSLYILFLIGLKNRFEYLSVTEGKFKYYYEGKYYTF